MRRDFSGFKGIDFLIGFGVSLGEWGAFVFGQKED